MAFRTSISSDENLTESFNGFKLKENLTKAVNLSCHGALDDFAWGSEMLAKEIPLKELKLKEDIFQIPVTLSVRIHFLLVLKVQYNYFVSYKIF